VPHIKLEKREPSGVLSFELIPKGAWYINVRSRFSKEAWDLLRKWVYVRADYQCEICGGVGEKHPVECHEVWEWKSKGLKGVQTLVGLVALCPKCHQAKHLGHSRENLSKTKFERVLSHQRRINKWSKLRQSVEWRKHVDIYRERCLKDWEVDTTYAERLLAQIMRDV
jgi:hypothetical protein